MNKGLIFTILSLAAAAANAAQTGKNSAEYKEAYRCATESFRENASGPASYCVGNSRDPSRLELKAYADAERDLKSGAASKKTAGACSFGYGSWVADGSRADDFLEGPQKAKTLREVAQLLPGRTIRFFDQHGQPISVDIVKNWFVMKGNTVSVSPEAKKTCSRKQIGG